MKTIRVITILFLTMGMLLANFSRAGAVPPQPSSFYGTVKLDGSNIAEGTIISAKINGVVYATKAAFLDGSTTVYFFDVPGDDQSTPDKIEGGVPGDIITFSIGDVRAAQAANWQSGTNVELNLSNTQLIYLPLIMH